MVVLQLKNGNHLVIDSVSQTELDKGNQENAEKTEEPNEGTINEKATVDDIDTWQRLEENTCVPQEQAECNTEDTDTMGGRF